MVGEKWQPDIIIGVDFGMTATAVAWTMSPEWAAPKNIQSWPGKLGHELHNKVDTAVSYDLQSGRAAMWGFLCDHDNEGYETNQYFKLNIDPAYRGPAGSDPPEGEACRWFRDYLSFLRSHLLRHFEETIGRFESMKVEYIFSVPTTWKHPTRISETERNIKAAGFGQRANERASVTLTEAEAAAVYALKQGINKGEAFVVCDAGGGTTDVNILRIASNGPHNMELEGLSYVEGIAIGSTIIDFKVRKIFEERLRLIQSHIGMDVDKAVDEMIHGKDGRSSKFMTFKCSFGSESMDVPKLLLRVPGLAPGIDLPQADVWDSHMVLMSAELQAIFDEQIEKMFRLIDGQLKLVHDARPGEIMSYLILSGGLGSSPYVRKKIRDRYGKRSTDVPPNATNMQVLLAAEPQLAVVHGLVMARAQTAKGGVSVYSKRCCPLSFGILSREEYDEKKHQGETIVKDPFDGKRWAENQIFWIIKQGQVVHTDWGVKKRYRLKIQMGREYEPWRCTIVTSELPADRLPASMRYNGARMLCEIETVLNHADMKRKNRHWYNLGKEYNRAEFDVRLVVGTGLRFEIVGKDGRRSREHEEIEVKWAPAI